MKELWKSLYFGTNNLPFLHSIAFGAENPEQKIHEPSLIEKKKKNNNN